MLVVILEREDNVMLETGKRNKLNNRMRKNVVGVPFFKPLDSIFVMCHSFM